MPASLIRSRAMVTHAIDRHRWNEVTDGAVLQEDGTIVEIGTYRELSRKHPNVAVVGSGNEVMLPGFVNGHHHIGLTPVQLGSPDMPLELWFVTRTGDAERQPLPRYALFGVRDDRVGCHDGPASARPYPRKTRPGGPGLRRGDPRLPGCRDARLLLVRGARPEPAGLPAGRGLHRQPAVRTARSDAAMVRAFSIDARRRHRAVRRALRPLPRCAPGQGATRSGQPALVLRRGADAARRLLAQIRCAAAHAPAGDGVPEGIRPPARRRHARWSTSTASACSGRR